MSIDPGRRKFLKQGGLFGLGLFTASVAKAADLCDFTPEQPEGPFYPVRGQLDTDTDLTRVKGRTGTAAGQVLFVHGQVRGLDCEPISGALVEIWQACESGAYDHPDDPNNAPRDPDFQYWGRTTTDSQGLYRFKTIKPGAYPAGGDWVRPPHIHFKITAPGFQTLITQMYFAGDPLNDKDHILRRLAPDLRERVVSSFVPAAAGSAELTGRFDIIIASAGHPGATPELD